MVTPIFSKMQESWSKSGYSAREIITVISVTFSCFSNISWSNGQNAPPPPNEKCLGTSLTHIIMLSKH